MPSSGQGVVQTRLRIVTWNCRSGPVAQRLDELREHDPHLVFLQECTPVSGASESPVVCTRIINARKSIALAAPSPSCSGAAYTVAQGSGRGALLARIVSPVRFVALGIWAQGPRYVQDVLRSLEAHESLLRNRNAVVLGDLNSGSRLGDRAAITRHHQQLLDACSGLGLLSAYHAFHGVACGRESHATYFHLTKRSNPWHIDFCFVPKSWQPRLLNVAVIDGRKWAQRSDHRPLLIELDLSQ